MTWHTNNKLMPGSNSVSKSWRMFSADCLHWEQQDLLFRGYLHQFRSLRYPRLPPLCRLLHHQRHHWRGWYIRVNHCMILHEDLILSCHKLTNHCSPFFSNCSMRSCWKSGPKNSNQSDSNPQNYISSWLLSKLRVALAVWILGDYVICSCMKYTLVSHAIQGDSLKSEYKIIRWTHQKYNINKLSMQIYTNLWTNSLLLPSFEPQLKQLPKQEWSQ